MINLPHPLPHKKKPHGVAMIVVISFIAVMVPVAIFLGMMGTSQAKQAIKFHESLQTESIVLSGNFTGLSRLRGNLRGLQQLTSQPLGEYLYDLTLRPTGVGLFLQDFYYVFSRSQIGRHQYILMSDAEQYQQDPNPPCAIMVHDYWNTVEPYDINNLADVTSMENYRGQDALALEELRTYERSQSAGAYAKELDQKKEKLPTELCGDWGAIVSILKEEKMPGTTP